MCFSGRSTIKGKFIYKPYRKNVTADYGANTKTETNSYMRGQNLCENI